jgi:Tfp pilus assembly PilM family ATPase/Tfp pilus assembly protein PilN
VRGEPDPHHGRNSTVASPKRCLGVDLGTSSVKVVELARERDAVRVLKCAMRELGLGPNASPEERAEATSAAVRDIIREQKITTRQAVFAVPGQAVFVKRVRLPRTTEERLHRIINYEARQQIPFPLDKTLLEFQVFDEPGDPQVEVLLVAIKREFVEAYMRTITRCRVKPLLISVSSLALFNFHLFDAAADELLGLTAREEKAAAKTAKAKGGLKLSLPFGRKKKTPAPVPEGEQAEAIEAIPGGEGEGLEGEGEAPFDMGEMDFGVEDVRAFLNVGASTLDIVIARFGKRKVLGFTRSVPIAGNEITRLVQDRLKLESFDEAEQVKRSKVAVVPEDEEISSILPDGSPEASAAATMLVNRLVAEIRRTLDFFVSQPDGVTVDSVVVSGGTSRLPNLAHYIEEKIGLLVEIKDAPVTERLICDAPPSEGWSPYFAALGMALTGLGFGKAQIDFLPTNLKDVREFKGKWAEIAVLAACLVVAIGFGMQMGESDITWLRNQTSNMEKLIQLSAPVVQLGQNAVAEQHAVKTQFDALSKLLAWRTYWPTILRDVILQWKPPQVYLTKIDLTAYGEIQISGIAHDDNAIAEYAANIGNNAGEFIQPDSVSIRTTAIAPTAGGQRQINFQIFMRAQTKRTSQVVSFREIFPPSVVQPGQPQPGQPGYGPARGAFPVEGQLPAGARGPVPAGARRDEYR